VVFGLRTLPEPDATQDDLFEAFDWIAAWDELNGASSWLPRGSLRLCAVIYARVPNVGSDLNLTLNIGGRGCQLRPKADAALRATDCAFNSQRRCRTSDSFCTQRTIPFDPLLT